MRGRMNDAKSYTGSFPLDQPMTGGAIGEIIESRMDGFAPGDLVLHMGGWRDGGIIGLDMSPFKLPTEALGGGMPPQTFLHNMGLTGGRSEEHTSELQSLMRISYAVFCLKNTKK